MSKNKYIIRQSPFQLPEHRNDDNHNLGFDYRKELMNKSVSSFLFQNQKNSDMLDQLNDLFVFLIDSVKNIKKTFMYSIDRNSRNLN